MCFCTLPFHVSEKNSLKNSNEKLLSAAPLFITQQIVNKPLDTALPEK